MHASRSGLAPSLLPDSSRTTAQRLVRQGEGKVMSIVLRALAGLASAGSLAASAAAETKWDMPTPYPDGNFHTKNVIQFAQDVDKATNGSLKIQVHSAGSLIKRPEIT